MVIFQQVCYTFIVQTDHLKYNAMHLLGTAASGSGIFQKGHMESQTGIQMPVFLFQFCAEIGEQKRSKEGILVDAMSGKELCR